jgi:hypothetical protein
MWVRHLAVHDTPLPWSARRSGRCCKVFARSSLLVGFGLIQSLEQVQRIDSGLKIFIDHRVMGVRLREIVFILFGECSQAVFNALDFFEPFCSPR